ncbi:MAG TPA: T9SS type A sorting domain-containing protein [Chitinispirillaceae bacterium]|nr:T9SS type A sorting domain-containing protein [Chitinispirillaceae bacterium]
MFHQSLVDLVPVTVEKNRNGIIKNLKFTPTVLLKNGRCIISYYGINAQPPHVAVFNLSGKKLPISFRWTRSNEGVNSISSVESLQNGIYAIKIDDGALRYYCTKVVIAR